MDPWGPGLSDRAFAGIQTEPDRLEREGLGLRWSGWFSAGGEGLESLIGVKDWGGDTFQMWEKWGEGREG